MGGREAAAATAAASLTALLVACGGSPKPPEVRVEPRYPALFLEGSFEPHGVGFCPVYRDRERSDSLATAMALRGLSWAGHVRVTGERLFQVRGAGELHFRGQEIELLDAPALPPVAVARDTCLLDDRVWVVSGGGIEACARPGTFPKEPPLWYTERPRRPGWAFAHGVSAVSHKDEAGAWEVATYRALIELAVDRNAQYGSLERRTWGAAEGAKRVRIDADLPGVRVVGRWRDDRNVHVLAATPVP